MKSYTVAVIGATGIVGKEIIEILENRNFPVKKLVPLASERSLGSTISFQKKHIPVEVLTEHSFEGVDIALFSAGGSISEKYAPHAVKAGAVVIDNTSHFRMDPEVPLVVPEVNPQDIKKHKGIIANPNCSTAQLVMALKPLHDAGTIKRIIISTYQSVSGAGKDAVIELEGQSRTSLLGTTSKPKIFPHEIAFNIIPQIDVFLDNGYTKEEMKMINETKKILGENEIQVTATAARVPVFIGHSEAVNVETEKSISPKAFKKLLKEMPGVELMDNPKKSEYPTPRNTSGKDSVYVGRIRKDISTKNGLSFWVVADNLRKGAALNPVQIAEELIQSK